MSLPYADERAPTASAKAELVERAKAGDHAAFAMLARTAFRPMYGAAKLILRDQDRAEDAVQEALLQAWRNIATIREPDAWDAWLYRLTVRACFRLAQQARAREVRELEVSTGVTTAPDFTGAVVDRDRIMTALSGLPIDQRSVVVLHFYLDLPLAEAAVVLDLPLGTAKSRLHRGLGALRRAVGDDFERVAPTMRERPT